MNDLISVIIPIYNVGPYLRRCLDSIKNQTYPYFECILVDDGSSDDSPSICDEYAANDQRFFAIHQKNTGVSAARNAGIARSKGKWINFVDGDDWIDLMTFETAITTANNENADVVIWKVKGEGIEVQNSNLKGNIALSDFPDRCIEVTSVWNKLIYSDLINRNEFFFPDKLSYAEDTFFSCAVLGMAKNIHILDNKFYHYFFRKESAIHNIKLKQINDYEKVINALKEFSAKKNIDLDKFILSFELDWKKTLMSNVGHYKFFYLFKTFPEANKYDVANFKNDAYKTKVYSLIIERKFIRARLWLAYFNLKIFVKNRINKIRKALKRFLFNYSNHF